MAFEFHSARIIGQDGTETELTVTSVEIRLKPSQEPETRKVTGVVTTGASVTGTLDVADWGARLPELQGYGQSLEAARPLLQRAMEGAVREAQQAVTRRGGITYCADDDGYVAVDGYSEEIGWFRDLLAFRYGEGFVSPLVRPEGENARFTFFAERAVSLNPRWKMYWEIE